MHAPADRTAVVTVTSLPADMNSVVVLAVAACLAQCILSVHVPVYPVGIHGAVYQGVHAGAYRGIQNTAASAPSVGLHIEAAHSSPVGVYGGPIAAPIVLPSGFIADTPEVVALRGAHLTALANARAVASSRGARAPQYAANNGQWASDGSYAIGGHGGRYAGPLATPVVLPSGFLADTPEVAAAKAAHLSTLAGAAAKAAHLASLASAASGVPYASGHGYHHGYPGYGYHHG